MTSEEAKSAYQKTPFRSHRREIAVKQNEVCEDEIALEAEQR